MTSVSSPTPPVSLERRLPPETAKSLTHEFQIGSYDFRGTITVAFYDHNDPAAVYIRERKRGGVVNGLLTGLSETTSLALQYGVPLEEILQRWKELPSFEPSGQTKNRDIPFTRSLLDYAAHFVEWITRAQPKEERAVLQYPSSPDDIKMTHKLRAGTWWAYLTLELQAKNLVGLNLNLGKDGGIVSGLAEGIASTASLALRYGIPVKDIADLWKGQEFEPSGFTNNPDIPHAKSILDYVGRYIELRFPAERGQQASA